LGVGVGNFGKAGVGVGNFGKFGYFTSDSATLVITVRCHSHRHVFVCWDDATDLYVV